MGQLRNSAPSHRSLLYSSLANHQQSQYQEYQIFHLFSIVYCDDKVLVATSLLKSDELS